MKAFKLGQRVEISEIYKNPPMFMGGTVVKIPREGTNINDNDITGTYIVEWNWDDCECERDLFLRHSIIFDGERHYFVRMDNNRINLVSDDKLKKEPRQIYTAAAAGFKRSTKKKYKQTRYKKSKKK